MKKLVCTFIVALLLLSVPFSALAKDAKAPQLKAISFKNAKIVEQFSPEKYDYTLVLDEPKDTPTLESYEVDGKADIFVTYALDEAKHQTGIIVTLEFENGSTIYNFAFSNAEFFEQSSNNLLKEVTCRLGVIYPAINAEDTDYTIYIPQDLTVLDLSAATQDVGAYCDVPKEVALSADQELELTLTVTASNGETRAYTFKVKRCEKSSKEFDALVKSGNTDIIVKSERFYQKPAFLIATLSVCVALLLLIMFISLAKRLTISLEDEDEQEFFE